VTPSRQPASGGGVSTTPFRITNTFDPVASQTSPRVLRKIASPASRSRAYASARTFSAYEVVLSPATAPRSLRLHGTITTSTVAGHGVADALMTITVGGPSPRSDPSGDGPPLLVSRAPRRTSARSAPAAARRRAGFSSGSAHSAAGSDSATIPAPTPKCVQPSMTVKVRMATLKSPASHSVSIQPTAPQYTPRGAGSR